MKLNPKSKSRSSPKHTGGIGDALHLCAKDVDAGSYWHEGQVTPPSRVNTRMETRPLLASSCLTEFSAINTPAAPAQLTLQDVITATRISSTSIYRMRKDGTFPDPSNRRGRRMYWSTDAIVKWLIANSPSNLTRSRKRQPYNLEDDPKGPFQRLWKDFIWNSFVPKGATHFITMNLGNPGSASSFNGEWAKDSRKIARRFVNILGRILFGKAGWDDPYNKARLDFYVRMETVPSDTHDGPEEHLHLHALIDLKGQFPNGCFSALAREFQAKLRESFGGNAFGFRISTKIQYILDDDHRRDIADYLSKKVWLDASRIYNRETL